MPSPAINTHRHISAATVRELCGGISDMTLWRWLDQRDFPEPARIGRRRYWRETEVLAWLNTFREAAQ
ncbi:helix-turn-helix transcriptional regulator [Maricaulis sp.]|uniref:helix-turn-helix transcriptional regulator n=1 Tax=Maricaulis sp. TaxID=1486257 RepID=UPI003A8FB68E